MATHWYELLCHRPPPDLSESPALDPLPCDPDEGAGGHHEFELRTKPAKATPSASRTKEAPIPSTRALGAASPWGLLACAAWRRQEGSAPGAETMSADEPETLRA